jgi:hypothetical protein
VVSVGSLPRLGGTTGTRDRIPTALELVLDTEWCGRIGIRPLPLCVPGGGVVVLGSLVTPCREPVTIIGFLVSANTCFFSLRVV